MRFQKKNRNKIITDEVVQLFSRSEPTKVDKPEKNVTLKEFQAIHQKVIADIRTTTKYIKQDYENAKVRGKITRTNYVIKTHWKYIREKEARLKKQVKEFEDELAKYDMVKMKYVIRRDFLKSNEDFQNKLKDADQKKQGVVTSMKNLISSKVTAKTWSPHSEDYLSEKKPLGASEDHKKRYGKQSRGSIQLADAIDTLTKALIDIPKLESKLNATTEMPRRQNPLIHQFNDLISKCNQTIQKIDRESKKLISEWTELFDTLNVELIEHDLINEIQENEEDRLFGGLPLEPTDRTEFGKAIIEYKKFRGKVISFVEEDVKCDMCNCLP